MARIVIIGGGVIGLCTAYYCAGKGHEVVVVERDGPERNGCSYGNAGMVVPSHFTPLAAPGMVALGLKWMWNPKSPFYIKPRFDLELLKWGLKFWRASTAEHVNRSAPLIRDLSFASRKCFETFAESWGKDFGLAKKGLLMLCQTSHAWEEEKATAARAKSLGIPAEVLDARQTASLDPNVQMDITGAVYFPQDCHLRPDLFMVALQEKCIDARVQFSFGTEATGFQTSRTRIDKVHTRRGEIGGDEFVLCGGSWSPALAHNVGLSLPMQAGKGYSLTLPSPRQKPEICAIFAEARMAITPMGSALRFGGTMELAGTDARINPLRVEGIIDAVPRYYPAFKREDFTGIAPWSGLRPCSPDGLPYMGRSRRFNNLSVATGHAMMGLSLGPISGKLMSQVLSGEAPELSIELLNPDRYAW